MGTALLPVLLFGRVEGFLVDLLRVFGQIVLTLSGSSLTFLYGTLPNLLCWLASFADSLLAGSVVVPGSRKPRCRLVRRQVWAIRV
jgi:hypothetical protein